MDGSMVGSGGSMAVSSPPPASSSKAPEFEPPQVTLTTCHVIDVANLCKDIIYSPGLREPSNQVCASRQRAGDQGRQGGHH
jgi:hypothetical protein